MMVVGVVVGREESSADVKKASKLKLSFLFLNVSVGQACTANTKLL